MNKQGDEQPGKLVSTITCLQHCKKDQFAVPEEAPITVKVYTSKQIHNINMCPLIWLEPNQGQAEVQQDEDTEG